MCGIAGIFAYRSATPVDRGELRTIRDHMALRGPDGFGEWFAENGSVGLGHRRLSIIDLSDRAAQPMVSADGQLVISFNGEIYNYRELKKDLEARGRVFRTESDTEVLLHLYAEKGEAMLGELRGMFAFALWDASKQAMFLARDPFGIKPLYYADDGKTFRFASQVKALLAGGQVDTAPEPAGHTGFFLWGHVPDPYTLYKGVRALPAGTSLWLEATGRRVIRQFFNASGEFSQASETVLSLTCGEVQERLSAALSASIRCHLIADVPLGIFLSAGLDSSTIAALAMETGMPNLSAVTLGFEEFRGTKHDEMPLAKKVAETYGLNHQPHWITKEEFRNERQRILDVMDQPTTDGVNTYFVCKAAKASGNTVMLSGLGGDELFKGYPSFRQIPLMVKMFGGAELPRILGKGFRALSGKFLKYLASPKYASLFEYGGTFGGAYLLRRGMFMPWELPGLFDPLFVLQGLEELQTLPRLEQTARGIKTDSLKVSALETQWYMRNQLLRDTDWASMAHSLEVRTPFVDIDLFRAVLPLLCSTCPPGKQIMASSPRIVLPAELLSRKKTGFVVPIPQWLADNQKPSEIVGRLKGWAEVIYQSHCNSYQIDALKKDFAGTAKNILVYRIGQLGDTLVSLPAIELIKKRYPEHRLVLLTDSPPGDKGYVSSWDILKSTGWFDAVIHYRPRQNILSILTTALEIGIELRALNIDLVFSLTPRSRGRLPLVRDHLFFRYVAGVKRYRSTILDQLPGSFTTGTLPELEPEWLRLIRIVDEEADGKNFSLRNILESLSSSVSSDIDLPVLNRAVMVAIAPGSKMPSKVWPLERFQTLGDLLLGAHPNIHLIVVGGPQDTELGRALTAAWGFRSSNLAGKLTVWESAAVIEQSVLFIGNDTGTMHLAALSGVPCVAIFSARDFPGKWNPYGSGHIVLRREVECSGCMLEICDSQNKCLTSIPVQEVLMAANHILNTSESRRRP